MKQATRSTAEPAVRSRGFLYDPSSWRTFAKTVLVCKTIFHLVAGAMHVCEANDTGRYKATIVFGAVELCLVVGAATLYFSVLDVPVESEGENIPSTSPSFWRPVANSIIFGYMFTFGDILSLFLPFLFNGSQSSSFAAVWTAVNADVVNFSSSLVMISPLLVTTLAPAIPDVHLGIFWVSCVTALVVGTLLAGDTASLFTVGNYIICSAFLMCALFRYRGFERDYLKITLDNERRDLEELMHQDFESNMRQMVANVAHDLKTPLASFVVGMDNIRSEVEDLELVISTTLPHPPQKLVASLSATKLCLQTMDNTNQFMLMTIHRVLDYAKASRGLKLIPKYETVDLQDALQLPLRCMTDLQQRIAIHFLPLPAEICSQVITDKQWLQENVLCLLSNAVKYSSEGLVTLSVSLASTCSPSDEQIAKYASLAWSPRTASKTKHFQPPSNQPSQSTFRTDRTWTDSGHIPSDELSSSCPSSSTHRESSRSLRIEVMDAGIGMSDEAMQGLFSPFQQTQRLAGGTGLGLFSLARRVEALHGRCGVQQRYDGRQGSLFWFEIPYRPDCVLEAQRKIGELDKGALGEGTFARAIRTDSRQRGDRRAATPATGGPPSPSSALDDSVIPFDSNDDVMEEVSTSDVSALILRPPEPVVSGNGRRVLLVDDSPTVLRLTAMQLRKAGFDVTTAENGAMALAALQSHNRSRDSSPSSVHSSELEQGESKGNALQDKEQSKPAFDVVLMDLQMPVMDGLEAVKRLRQWEHSLLCPSVRTLSTPRPLPGSSSSSSLNAFVSTDANSRHLALQNTVELPVHVKPQPIRQRSPSPSAADAGDADENPNSASSSFRRLPSPLLARMPSNKTVCTMDEISPAVPCLSTSLYSNHAEPSPSMHHVVIGLSANSDTDTLNASITAGFDGFLCKPFTMGAFTDLMQQLS